MKHWIAGLMAALCASATAAQDISTRIGDAGLAVVEAELASQPSLTDAERFALGGVRFLRATEIALQTRWRHDVADTLRFMPFFRLPLGPNPAAEPIAPDTIDDMFREIEMTLAGSIEALDAVGNDPGLGLVIDTGDLWFDVNANGTRDAGEELFAFLRAPRDGGDLIPPTIRFDSADVKWLSAYAHLLSAFSDLVVAAQTPAAIATVQEADRELERLTPGGRPPTLMPGEDDWITMAATIILALEAPPLPERTRAAHGHLKAMIADNREFWDRIAAETDNDREWIPSSRQVSALPFAFPEGTAEGWQAVLDDAERLLDGELLLPFWRVGKGAGLDLKALFADPPALDIAGMAHGHALLPYLKEGQRIDADSLRAFEELTGGNAWLFAVILN